MAVATCALLAICICGASQNSDAGKPSGSGSGSVASSGSGSESTAAGNSPHAVYDALVKRVQAGDQTVDLNQLRLAAGDAGIQSNSDARDKLLQAARRRDYPKMAAAADEVLQSNYADLDGHFFAKIAAKELSKPELAEFHRWVEMGLLRSLVSSGDGKSPETAMKVISVDEEYFFLQMMRQETQEQALGHCGKAPCDIMTTIDENNAKHTWYFDVSIPMGALEKELGAGK